jgi:hypothetical protein
MKIKISNYILYISNRYPLGMLIVLYALSNFLMLFNDGVFWDDWTLYNMSYSGIMEHFNGNGGTFMGIIHYYLQNLTSHPSILYHFLTFTLELLGIILFYKIANHFLKENVKVFWLTALFALIPYNEAKITMICLPYTIGFFLFLLATHFFILFLKNSNFIYRVLSIVAFFFSFMFLNSVLVLMLGFILFMAMYPNKLNCTNYRIVIYDAYRRMLSWLDFIILPFVFWIFRHFYFTPSGVYKDMGYNQVSLSNIFYFPINALNAINNNIIGLGFETLGSVYFSVYLFLFFLIVLTFLFIFYGNKSNNFTKHLNFNSTKDWFFVGIYFSVICSFAYLIVGKTPSFFGFDSRHQILLKISTPILIIWAVGLIKSNFQKYTLLILISLFIVTSIKQNIQYIGSWFKQEALANEFVNNKNIKNGDYILVVDSTNDLNETETGYSFYSFAGMSKKVFKNQSRFIILAQDLIYLKKVYNLELFIKGEGNNMSECKAPINFGSNYVLIQYKEKKPSIKDILLLLFNRYFSMEKFNKDVNEILNVTSLH